MDYKVVKEKGSVKINFTVSEQEWDSEVESCYNKTKKKYNVQGFRKGHAPRKAIERMYGPTIFFDDAFNEIAQKGYTQALTENEDIFPVDRPSVDITKFAGDGTDMEFTMTVTTRPEVELGAYTGLTVDKTDYKVAKDAIDEELKKAQERGSRQVSITDRAVIDGDTVNLNYSGSVDGVKFDGGTADNQTLVIGSNSFIPGFESQMIGMAIGEEKDIKVKFPDEYHSEDLKGKDAIFAVKVNGITAKEVPELNDEFAKDTTKFESLAEYKADIKNRLEKEASNRSETEGKNALLEKAVENSVVDIPKCMIDEEVDYMLQDFEQRLMYMYQGLKIEDYFKYTNSSVEDFKKERKDEALKSVKTRLVMQEIIKAEKLEPTDEDFDKKVAQMAEDTKKTVDEVKAGIDQHQNAHMRNDITINKLMDFLVEKNSFNLITEKQAEANAKAKAKASEENTTAKKTTAKKSTVKKETADKE